jgi:CSLREA domain-containing protein
VRLASRHPTRIYLSREGAGTRAKIEQAFDDGVSLMSCTTGRRSRWTRTIVASVLWLVAAPSATHAATFVVNSVGDEAALAPIDGVACNSTAGTCTLRAAIEEANASAAADVINFSIAPAGAKTITPATQLPLITNPVTINGTTQPGFSGAPVIEINGSLISGSTGLSLQGSSNGSTIRGLVINRLTNTIELFSANNVVVGNYLGTDLTGTLALGNAVGVIITSSGNRVGGLVAADRNIISANNPDGIQLLGGGAQNNLVQGNYIGLDATGTADLGNVSQGISMFGGASNNTIGGTVAGAGNVISGNDNEGVRIESGGTGNLVQGNYIGTNAAGTAAIGNTREGVHIFGAASNNVVGGSVAARNVISGNLRQGIRIQDLNTNNNLVACNYIGTNAAGTAGVPNQIGGIAVTGQAADNTIGGPAGGNVIAFNTNWDGISVESSATGTAILGNSVYSNQQSGIDLLPNAGITSNDLLDADTGSNNLQNFPALSAAMSVGGNVQIAGSLMSAASTTYRIEFFANTAAILDEGERFLGAISIATNASGNAVFGTTFAAAVAPGEYVTATATDPGNNTSEFSAPRLVVGSLLVTTTADTSDGNTASVAGLVANPGADGGISLREAILAANGTAGPDTIGFGIPLADAGHLYYQNDAIGGALTSIQPTTLADTASATSPAITDFDPDFPAGLARSWYRIQPASLLPIVTGPLTIDGTTQPGFVTGGPVVEIVGTSNGTAFTARCFTIPGATSTTTIRGLVINMWGGEAITSSATSTVVQGNYIGTDPSGTLARGNGRSLSSAGIYIGANGGQIGGLTGAERNVISGNLSDGAWIDASNVVVQGNYIGTDVTGAAALGNGYSGVVLSPVGSPSVTNVTVGGTSGGSRNVISGNSDHGVLVSGANAQGNLVQGNYIGTNAAGTAALGNVQHGVRLASGATGNTIGGTTVPARNVLSGNGGQGVRIDGSGTANNVVAGNLIGTNAAGAAAVPNASGGVAITSSAANNRIGGTAAGAGNKIAFNTGGDGINVAAAAGTGNAILGNSIVGNAGLGIDILNDGVTANDALDADTGPNDLLNFSLITASYENAGTLTTHFQLDVPAGSYRVEFFKNPSGIDGTGFGEGETLVASKNVTHPGGGIVTFNHSFAGVVGDRIAATTTFCTDGATCAAFGSTSEFSKAYTAVPTAVMLSSFTAEGRDRAVDLSWTTASELSNLGFHLYRADSAGGPYTRITPALVPGLGSSPTGRSYAYRDTGLVNGRAYFYQLEDVETTGRTEKHGPVSATPHAASAASPPSGDPSETSYGEPATVELREVERSATHVVLELRTGGFLAASGEDGRVRLRIPGFESVSRPGEPKLPTRRAFVEAVAGRQVRLMSVQALEEVSFPGLRPETQGVPVLEVDESGSVMPSEEKRREGRAFKGVYPREWSTLLGTSFQGERKRAEVLFAPLRWDGSGLVLSRRVVVRLEFAGREARETSRGGSRGRLRVERGALQAGVVAQLEARQHGLYRVSYEEIFGAEGGRERRRIPLSSLRLSRQGESVAFHAEPESLGFGPGSWLFFLSEGSSLNAWGDAVYELETSAEGVRMRVESLAETPGTATHYLQDVVREENVYYQAGLLEAPDLWLWDVLVSPGSRSYDFAVEGLETGVGGRLSMDLQGASDVEGVVDHHVRVKVNGSDVGEAVWDGKKPQSLDLVLEPGVLREGANVLELEDPGATSMVFLDRFRVSYPRRLQAIAGTLEGSFDQTGAALLQGLGASSVVLDTAGRAPRWLTGATLTGAGLNLPARQGRRYFATSTFLHPEVRPMRGAGLRSATNRADYLLVAPQAFLGAAQPLLALRESQGLATKAVALEDVYAQFGHGEAGPEGIKEFLEYAYHMWSEPSFRYVVLLGDASYDPKDYLGTGVKDWLPGFPVRTSYLWTVSDSRYASVNGEDSIPDVAIGRLPAGSVDEALVLVQKIIGYENGSGRLDGNAVLVADNTDLGGDFEADAEEIANGILASRNPARIYLSREGAGTRARIEQAFDEGASLMSYVGHGATTVWASENVFNRNDVKDLRPQSRQPFLMTMNCLNGFFHFPPLNSLSEELLKAEGKGVMGAFSPSGLSVNGAARAYHQALLEEIVSGRHERLGDAILAAQERYAQSGAFPELLAIYHLFGDPAVRVR